MLIIKKSVEDLMGREEKRMKGNWCWNREELGKKKDEDRERER